MSQEQETAIQIIQTSNRIATPEQLAVVMQTEPRYYSLEDGTRVAWLGQQIITLNYMVHSQKVPNKFDLLVESKMLDQAIMDEDSLRSLTMIEMQDAFRRGISREYGDFYGITAPSLIGFLNAYKKCEKRSQAIAILYSQEQKKLREEDELFWETLNAARKAGFEIPTFPHSPFEDDKQHLERIARQREEILKQTKKDA